VELKILSRDEWKKYAENAHLAVFGERRSAEMDRIDFVMLMVKGDVPVGYITAREVDQETVYLAYGGAFPGSIETVNAVWGYKLGFDYVAKNYKRATTLIENTNRPMLKLAMKFGWLIKGIRVFKDSVLLEHQIEFGG
jgi:hypothetical protein